MRTDAEYEAMRARAEDAERKLALITSWHEAGFVGSGDYDHTKPMPIEMLDRVIERTRNIRILLGIELPPREDQTDGRP